jgi:hypothetical protein
MPAVKDVMKFCFYCAILQKINVVNMLQRFFSGFVCIL